VTLQGRLEALAAAIRTKINAMMPRLQPAGGSAGQVLAKNTANDYDSAWITSGTVRSVVVTQPLAGITVSNSGTSQTVNATSAIALANDLAAVEALTGTGFAKRTGTDAWSVSATVALSELAAAPSAGVIWASGAGAYAHLASGGGTTNYLRADGTWAQPPGTGGGSNPWTTVKLAADFIAANTNTFANVTDGTTTLTFTPPANSDWEMTAKLNIQTATAANLPRVGLTIGGNAANGYGSANIWGPAAAATGAGVGAFGGWANNAAAVNIQMAAGGVVAANTPAQVEISASGRSGASPQPIIIQMANETAAANMGKVLRGSFLRWQVL
jgi:hypothetical protein